ncbi:unnamed protein product [Staurois parvus]|uniref:Uncharacterized protein n=1 Tax=Staurois parvus TaxID=386267 RepID=A0ABN9CQR7_9NEOB|nr:unnamed protein product [Staurois parvus]
MIPYCPGGPMSCQSAPESTPDATLNTYTCAAASSNLFQWVVVISRCPWYLFHRLF